MTTGPPFVSRMERFPANRCPARRATSVGCHWCRLGARSDFETQKQSRIHRRCPGPGSMTVSWAARGEEWVGGRWVLGAAVMGPAPVGPCRCLKWSPPPDMGSAVSSAGAGAVGGGRNFLGTRPPHPDGRCRQSVPQAGVGFQSESGNQFPDHSLGNSVTLDRMSYTSVVHCRCPNGRPGNRESELEIHGRSRAFLA
jgi:hypothetical protein